MDNLNSVRELWLKRAQALREAAKLVEQNTELANQLCSMADAYQQCADETKQFTPQARMKTNG